MSQASFGGFRSGQLHSLTANSLLAAADCRQSQWCSPTNSCWGKPVELKRQSVIMCWTLQMKTFANSADCFLCQDSEAITALAFAPDGNSLFSASRSLQQKWWNIESGTCLRTWKVRTHTLHIPSSILPCQTCTPSGSAELQDALLPAACHAHVVCHAQFLPCVLCMLRCLMHDSY